MKIRTVEELEQMPARDEVLDLMETSGCEQELKVRSYILIRLPLFLFE